MKITIRNIVFGAIFGAMYLIFILPLVVAMWAADMMEAE